jgi:hypothetical protein
MRYLVPASTSILATASYPPDHRGAIPLFLDKQETTMTTLTTKTRLTALALAAATFTTATLLASAGASAKPAQAFRAEPVSMHNSGSALNKEAFRATAPVTLQHPVQGAAPPRRVHPADDECLEVDGHKYLCTGGAGAAFTILGILAL